MKRKIVVCQLVITSPLPPLLPGEVKLLVNSEKKGTMVYNAKEEILRAMFLQFLENSQNLQ